MCPVDTEIPDPHETPDPVSGDFYNPEKCPACGQPVLYETLAGTRIFRMVGAARVYRCRCGCGDFERGGTRYVVCEDHGKPPRAVSDHGTTKEAYAARDEARRGPHPSACVRVGHRDRAGSWVFV